MADFKDDRTSIYFDRDKREFVGIDKTLKKQLSAVYKGIDLDVELGKMELWLSSSKGKNRKGSYGFIINWLNNTSRSKPSVLSPIEQLETDSPLDFLLQEYRRGLWKNREHILEFNTIRI